MSAAQFLSLFFGDLYFIRLHLCDYRQKSERITHSQMEAMRVFEGIDIVEALLAGFVRHMKPHTPVYTDDEHTHIIAHTHTRAYSHLLEELSELELSLRTVLLAAKCPHVAGIKEQGSIQVAPDARTILNVGKKLNVACLVDIGILAACRQILTGANASHIESTHTVGTANVELLVIKAPSRCCHNSIPYPH